MERLIFLAPIRVVGAVACRVPSCQLRASAHIDVYMLAGGEQSWDARSSGPVCKIHLERMQSDWQGCEVRSEASMEATLALQSA
jgi:hypothetical protein